MLGVLVLLVGACGVWLFTLNKPAFDASNEFLALVDSGDYNAAAASTSCNISVADLEEVFAGQDIIYNLSSSSVRNGSSATVSGSLEVPTKSYSNISLSLFKSADEWTVCTFFIS